MSTRLPPPDDETYVISMNTSTLKQTGLIKVLKVRIFEDVMDMGEIARVDLADHPRYSSLQNYVKSNPRK